MESKPGPRRPQTAVPAGRRIVIAVGLPGSGKSTWFARRGIVPISSDSLRQLLLDDQTDQSQQAAIFSALRWLLRMRLALGRPVTYVDATNLDRHARRMYFQLAGLYGYSVDAIFFKVPAEVCLQRNAARGRQVPRDVMERFAHKLRPPTHAEGFRRIMVVDAAGRARLLRRSR